MKKINKIIIGITSLAMGLILTNFAFSDIMGVPEVVDQFAEMAQPLGINPTLFRLFSRITILIASLAYLTSGMIGLIKSKENLSLKLSQHKIGLFANGFGILVMLGALIAEFFMKTKPKLPLLYLSIGIISQSYINLKLISKHVALDVDSKLDKINYESSIA